MSAYNSNSFCFLQDTVRFRFKISWQDKANKKSKRSNDLYSPYLQNVLAVISFTQSTIEQVMAISNTFTTELLQNKSSFLVTF